MKKVVLIVPSALSRPGQCGSVSLLVQKIWSRVNAAKGLGSNLTRGEGPGTFLLMLICRCSGVAISQFLLAVVCWITRTVGMKFGCCKAPGPQPIARYYSRATLIRRSPGVNEKTYKNVDRGLVPKWN